MTLSKTLAECLYRLYGPNGSDALVHHSQKRDWECYKELERHGLVKVVAREGKNQFGLFDVVRQERSLVNGAPLQVFPKTMEAMNDVPCVYCGEPADRAHRNDCPLRLKHIEEDKQ